MVSPRALLATSALSFVLLAGAASAADGVAVMKRVGEAMRSPGEEVSVTMQLVRASGATETRTFRSGPRPCRTSPPRR